MIVIFRAKYLPRWLLEQRLNIVVAILPIGGLQVTLRAIRIRHHREPIFYKAYDGLAENVRLSLDLGRASVHDVTDTTFTSLLHVSSAVNPFGIQQNASLTGCSLQSSMNI